MRILITGGLGFIGSHLAKHFLTQKNTAVIILDNCVRGSTENLAKHSANQNLTVIQEDIRTESTLQNIGPVDIVYHLAAISTVAGASAAPDAAFSVNVEGTYLLLKYAQKNKVSHFIFASSREVYGNAQYTPVDELHPLAPLNMYGATKAAAEMMCRAFFNNYGLPGTIARLANVYGPRDKGRVIPIFIAQAKKNETLTVFGGNQILDFIWIDDVVAALAQLAAPAQCFGRTINIATGKGTSIEELARLIIRLANSRSQIIKKETRTIDTQNYIGTSKILKLKTTPLSDGLRKMI